MDKNDPITTLTVEQLQNLIRSTVQEAVAEVLVEFSIAAEQDAEVLYQAELAEMLRESLHGYLHDLPTDLDPAHTSDD